MAQSYYVIDVPGSSATHPLSINNGGDIAGYFCSPGVFYCQPDRSARGFVRKFDGNITTFDGVPTSINNAGTVAGYFTDTTGFLRNFVRDTAGNITVFDVPQVSPFAYGFATAISESGDVAGYFLRAPNSDQPLGFVRDRQGDIATFVNPRGVVATAINARGDITGHTAPFYFREAGFVRDRNGNITYFDISEADAQQGPRAIPVSINNGGDVAGYFYNVKYNRLFGFVRERDGNITTFEGIPASINDAGTIAGSNFLRDKNGNITVFEVPNAFGAQRVVSINDRGDVAGYFGTHGFVRSAQ